MFGFVHGNQSRLEKNSVSIDVLKEDHCRQTRSDDFVNNLFDKYNNNIKQATIFFFYNVQNNGRTYLLIMVLKIKSKDVNTKIDRFAHKIYNTHTHILDTYLPWRWWAYVCVVCTGTTVFFFFCVVKYLLNRQTLDVWYTVITILILLFFYCRDASILSVVKSLVRGHTPI